jgi:predicted dehydrogenase
MQHRREHGPTAGGFIGTGRISDLHALEYLANERRGLWPYATPIWRRPAGAGGPGVSPTIRIFTDYHDLLALPDVDLVENLLPHHLHYQSTLDIAAAGKQSPPKPMALTVQQATR